MTNRIGTIGRTEYSYTISGGLNSMKAGAKKTGEGPAYLVDISGRENEKTKKLSSREKMLIREQTERTKQKLIDLIEKLLNRQVDLTDKNKLIKANADGTSYGELSVEEAQAAISEDGAFGVKAVSDRIVSFAIAISGDDPSKLDELKKAIDKGFEQARRAFGCELPEICSKTYDEIMRKLDEWAGRTGSKADPADGTA